MSGDKFSSIKDLKVLEKWKFLRFVGQTQDSCTKSPKAEKGRYCTLILLGIFEVLLNTISTELEKATDVAQVKLEKELIEFINLYNSLEKDTSKQGKGIKRVNPRSTASDTLDNIDSSHTKLC